MAQLLNAPKRPRRGEGDDGIAMVIAVILTAIVFTLGAVWVGFAEHATSSSRYARHNEQAVDAANAALAVAAAGLAASSSYSGAPLTPFPGGAASYEVTVGGTGFRRVITATGYAPGPDEQGRARRTMRQVVDLDPVGFEHAILAEGNVTTGSAATVSGSVYSNGNVTLGNAQDIDGNVYAQGNITTGSNQTITGNLYADGNVTVGSSSTEVVGSVYAGGNITTGGWIDDDAVAGGSIGCGKVRGTCSPNTPPPPVPVQHIPTFTWNAANYPSATLYGSGTALVNALKKQNASGAHRATGNVTFSNNDTLYLVGDLTIVATGDVSLPKQVENHTPGGTPVQLSVITPGNLTLANNFTIPSTVHTLMYTSGNFTAGNSSTFSGVLYAANLTVGSNLKVEYAPVDDPGFDWSAANPQTYGVRNVSTQEINT